MRKLPAILLLVLCLAACNQPQPTGISLPTFTTRATATQGTLLPTQTMTARPTVTETPLPDFTYTLTDWQISYDATYAAVATQAAPFSGICEGREFSNPYRPLFSSDGEWLALNCDQLNLSGMFQVLKKDGSRSIEISYKDLYADLKDICAIGADPLHWTADDQYLFFSRRFACWESGGPIPLGMKNGPLYRLDLRSGHWEKIIADDAYDIYYYFSPTDRRVAYIHSYRSPIFNILDLKTGNYESFSLPDYYEAGGVVWSPDGKTFAFTASRPPENADFEHMKYSVFIYDVITKNLRPIISNQQERRIPQKWTKGNLLVIPLVVNDYFYQIVPGQTLYYDVNANTFVQVTPNP